VGDGPTPTVAIVGSGNLGQHYLRGLLEVAFPLEVFVVDVDPGSLAGAEAVWTAAGGRGGHRARFMNDPVGLPARVDLAIVATTADRRSAVARQVSGEAMVANWVFEKVLAQTVADLDVLLSVVTASRAAWVNTWGRATDWYQQVRVRAGTGGPYRFCAAGGSWGMGCNSIHLIDLSTWWSGEELVSVDSTGLDDRWWPAKRSGFHEPSGSLRAFFDGGSVLEMSAGTPRVREGVRELAGLGDLEAFVIEGRRGPWVFESPWSEVEGVARGPEGETVSGRIEHQSERTAGLVEGILEGGTCDLPTIDESVDLHRPLLDALIAHWSAVTGEKVDRVPIT